MGSYRTSASSRRSSGLPFDEWAHLAEQSIAQYNAWVNSRLQHNLPHVNRAFVLLGLRVMGAPLTASRFILPASAHSEETRNMDALRSLSQIRRLVDFAPMVRMRLS